jgi:putative chitinase
MSIKIFQKNNGLKPDGIVGRKTLTAFKKKFKLTDEQTAHFFGQIAHETADFKYSTENLNYSAKGLLRIFKKYFPTLEDAQKYARQPRKIANKVYGNRMGNGSETSGDGWRYRGRGAIQLTGFNNYRSFSHYIKDEEVISNPDIVATKYYLESALFFFNRNNLFKIMTDVERKTVQKVTKRINGGYNGLDHRYELTLNYYKILKKNGIKKQNNEVGNTSSSSGDSSTSNKELFDSQETGESKVRKQSSHNFKGFFAKIIRWLLSKTGSRYAY